MKQFLAKYKVFITGFIGAVFLAVAQVDATNGLEFKDLIMPAVIAIASWVGNNFRGQWVSIAGIGFTVLIGYMRSRIDGTHWEFTAQTFQWIVVQLGILLFGFNAAPFKDRSYEKDPAIVEAKTVTAAEEKTTVTPNVAAVKRTHLKPVPKPKP